MRVRRSAIPLALALWSATSAQAGIGGRILSSEGEPLTSARVVGYAPEAVVERAERLMAGGRRPPVAVAQVDGDGAFQLDHVPAVVDVVAIAEGFAPAFVTLADTDTVTLALSPAATVRGVVRGRSGGPIVGATVAWRAGATPTDSGEIVLRTGRDGSYEVPDPDVWARALAVAHPDFAPLETSLGPLEFRPAASLHHELDDGVAIVGRVFEAVGGRAVESATIVVDGWPLARSSTDGSFVVRHAPSSWRHLVARGGGLVGEAAPRSGGPAVPMQPARRLRGVVLDAKTKAPLVGAVVAVSDDRSMVAATAITDEHGLYVLDHLPPGRYRAWSTRTGYASSLYSGLDVELVDLRRAAAGERTLRLAPLRRLVGRVQDEQGRPLAGALVRPWVKELPSVYATTLEPGGARPTAWTARDGTFALTLEEGWAGESSGVLLALKPGYAVGRLELGAAGSAPGVITLTRGLQLTGRISTPDGQPVPGVSVSLAEAKQFGGMPPFLSGTLESGWTLSDERGRFATRVHAVGHHAIFRKSGFVPREVRVQRPVKDPHIEVELEPAAQIRGAILRSDGTGVSEVQLYLMNGHTMRPSLASTSVAGDFLVGDLSPGTYELHFAKEGTALGGSRTVIAPDGDARIQLGPAATVRGRVADASTRAPVERFSVELEPTSSTEPDEPAAHHAPAIEATGGEFTIGEVPLGEATLTVRAEGFVALRLERVSIMSEAEVPILEITLDRGARIQGLVTDESGEPLADVRVSAEADDGESPSAATDDLGEYDLPGVAPGRVSLEFRRQGYVTVRRALDTAATTRADATLSSGLVVNGIVLADGEGVPGARVWADSSVLDAERASTSTDEGGRFTLEGLVRGRYTIGARTREGGEAAIEDVDVERAGWLRLPVPQPQTAILSGWVSGLLDTDDIQRLTVRAQGDGDRHAYATVDETGWFRMDEAPTGTVTVQANATTSLRSERSTRAEELTLLPDSETEILLEFTEGLVVSGYVTRKGTPAAGAQVRFEATDTSGLESSALSGRDGHYQVMGLEPGHYRVSVWARDVSHSSEHTLTGHSELDLDVTGAMLSGLVLDAASGSPLADVSISLWRVGPGENTPEQSTRSNSRGEFTARSVEEGRYRLLASKEGFGQGVREVDLRRGEGVEIELELETSDGLTLEVVDARDDRPLDATVVARDLARRIVANRSSRIGSDGSLNIALAPGQYLLSASADGYGTVTRAVAAPSSGLRLGLTPGGTLVLEAERPLRGRVRLVGEDGEEYVRCWCNGLADIDLDGRRTTVEHVAPGHYTLEVLEQSGATSTQRVAIREAQTVRVAIE